MLIKDVCKKTKLTKKAIEYYIEQNLVHPSILENGYRDFSKQDIAILSKISIYRKLGVSIAEIEMILKDESKLDEIIYKYKMKLENEKKNIALLERISQKEPLESIEKEILENFSQNTILEKLEDLFPGYFGRFITMHFYPYLQNKIESKAQKEALHTIISWLDNTIPLQLSKKDKEILDFYSAEINTEFIQQSIQIKENNIIHFESFIQENKEMIQQYLNYKKSETYKNSEVYQLQKMLEQFCKNSGYNEVFIPTMRILSPAYNAYYKKLLQADEIFKKEFNYE